MADIELVLLDPIQKHVEFTMGVGLDESIFGVEI